jgi:hypothetical protein
VAGWPARCSAPAVEEATMTNDPTNENGCPLCNEPVPEMILIEAPAAAAPKKKPKRAKAKKR